MQLLQLRVFGLGLFQDGDVGVGIFPKREELLVRSFGFDHVSGKSVGSSQSQVCQCADRVHQNQPRVIDDFLKLGSSSGNLLDRQVRIAPEISWIKQCGRTQFVGGWYGEDLNPLRGSRLRIAAARSSGSTSNFIAVFAEYCLSSASVICPA